MHGISGALVVDSVKELPSPPVVHNLIVEGFHTYFVGEKGMLVHDITYRQPTRALVPGLLDDSGFQELVRLRRSRWTTESCGRPACKPRMGFYSGRDHGRADTPVRRA